MAALTPNYSQKAVAEDGPFFQQGAVFIC